MSKSKELVTVDANTYPVLADGGEMARVMRENMGDERIGADDLLRIKVPAGGGTAWSVPDDNGEEESLKFLDGIVVHIDRRRAYWPSSDPTGDPPVCTSEDCLRGHGTPGGNCLDCPHEQFGSATKPDGSPGRGKACKETKRIFLLRAGSVLPDVVTIPAASLKPMRLWQLRLRQPIKHIVTRLALKKVTNKDNIGYAEIVPTRVGELDEGTRKVIDTYIDEMKPMFIAAAAAAGDDDDPIEV